MSETQAETSERAQQIKYIVCFNNLGMRLQTTLHSQAVSELDRE